MQRLHQGRARKNTLFQQVQEESEQFDWENYSEANMEQALRQRDLNSMRQRIIGSTIYIPYPLCSDVTEIGRFSPGLQLYFSWLKYTIIFCGILSLICIPHIYININGNQLTSNQRKSYIDLTTIANQQYFTQYFKEYNSTTISQSYKEILKEKSEDNSFVYISLDFLQSIIFFLYIICIKIKLKKEAKQLDNDNITPKSFTIEILNLPTEGYQSEELVQFFSKFDVEVAEVNFARNYNGCLRLLQEISKLESKKQFIEIDQSLVTQKRSQTKIKQLTQKIQNKRKILKDKMYDSDTIKKIHHSTLPILRAYITFNSYKEKKKIFKMYTQGNNDKSISKQICNYFFGFKQDELPKHLFVLGKSNVEVREPDEPSNIKWENLEVNSKQRLKRSVVVYSVIALILVINFIIILLCNGLTAKNYECVVQQNLNTEVSVQTLKGSSEKFRECYCNNIDEITLIQDIEIIQICEKYTGQRYLGVVINFGLSFLIIGINLLLRLACKYLAVFQRFQTLTREIISTSGKIFISMFINTAIVPLLANSAVFNFKISEHKYQIMGPYLPSAFSTQFQTDELFSQNWYLNVGNKIIISMIINIISPHVFLIIIKPILTKIRLEKSKNCKYQKQLYELILDPEFDIHSRCAFAVNTVFVCLTYSGGMPILVVCAFLGLLLMYWCDKFILMRYSKKPHMLDNTLVQSIQKTLPLCLILHLISSICTYGAPGIMVDEQDPKLAEYLYQQYGQQTEYYQLYKGQVASKFDDIIRRCQKTQQLTLLLGFILVYFFMDIVVLPNIYICFKKKNQVFPEETNDNFGTFQQEFDRLMWQGVPSYNINLNPLYKPYVKIINNDDQENQGNLNKDELDSALTSTINSNNVSPKSTQRKFVNQKGKGNQSPEKLTESSYLENQKLIKPQLIEISTTNLEQQSSGHNFDLYLSETGSSAKTRRKSRSQITSNVKQEFNVKSKFSK